MKQQLISKLTKLANDINEKDSFYGKFALQKLQYINEETPLETIVQVGDDITLIATKVMGLA